MKNYDIKYVAVYLRKSRGDEDRDLEKHRMALIEICQQYNWKYIEYKEIGTSDSIEMRPRFKKLLTEIEDELYDAVLVIDIDRLSRGSSAQQEFIHNKFRNSNTLIITPQKIYDLNNETDETYVDFQSFMARQEYKMIKKRLMRGKKFGSRRGDWTNGTPPFPYDYQKYKDKFNEKGLVVNDEKYIIYRRIISMALIGRSLNEIAVALNKDEIKTPKGNEWHNNTVRRMLMDETHLGKIISNKTSGDGHKRKKDSSKPYKKLPKSEWIIVENCHEPVKTQEEHDKILYLLKQRALYVPSKARKRSYALSGILKCKVCGSGITFLTNKNGKKYIKPCWKRDGIGNKCPNKGFNYIDVFSDIIEVIEIETNELKNRLSKNFKAKINTDDLELTLEIYKKDLLKFKNALNKVNEIYELGDYTKEEWIIRKDSWNKKIQTTENNIQLLNSQIKAKSTELLESKIILFTQVIAILKDVNETEEHKNLALKMIIEFITFENISKDKKPKLQIQWL